METYIGYIKTPQDALIVFEACRRGQLDRVQRRLSTKERIHIRSGSVFAWDEREAGMRRWTDGRTWSPSRVLGSFLTYRELDTKRRPRRSSTTSSSSVTTSSAAAAAAASPSSCLPAGSKAAAACSYKQDGLIKQSFSICTAANQKLHLISYYTKTDVLTGRLKQPSADPMLSQIVVPRGLYPELNPLDTSGGHSATIHNMRQASSTSSMVSSPPMHHHHHHAHHNKTSIPPSPPPSLSSSPISSDEDMVIDSSSSPHYDHHFYTATSQPPPPPSASFCHSLPPLSYPTTSSSSSSVAASPLLAASPSSSSSSSNASPLLPIQEIPMNHRLRSSEDQRQLSALHGRLHL
ncbi:Gti1/Pac2 family-domain-containing protein [Zychaea mexicana]|uniref:Gti1/Pac2 family-domain-containing protein n=1 Tax=Zychaea mexicana TaxID=64656 RepID=UPI0022FEBDC0|nr:Gti1/Pac2 family-domain-containing protein [Zychaea mexicana]KAI9488390.1 Gti1/Pac2 family-domain-containing protein [Zychaea mexicana]